MSSKPATVSAAQGTVLDAFHDLEKVISAKDSRAFQSTTLDDVREAALKIEKQLAAKLLSRNMRRLEPLFKGLEAYHQPLEVLCNGTPYLPWIWAPIKLILQISADYVEALEEILKAYSRVAESLSRFDRFRVAFAENALFQQSLANFLSHLVEFHKEAYRFLHRRSWKRLFSTSWNRFRRRFDHVIKDLDHQAELLDREAASYSITAVESIRQDFRQWHTTNLEKLAEDEKQSTLRQFQSVMSWLKADSVISEQENIIDAITEEPRKYSNGSSWILKSSSLLNWLQDRPESPIIWLRGKAGSGKSVIATEVASFFSTGQDRIVVRHFCSYAHQESLQYERILTSFISQLLQHNNLDSDLIGFVYDDCVTGKKVATLKTLETLLITLLQAITPKVGNHLTVRLILDGLDECDQARQGKLLSLIKQIVSIQPKADGPTLSCTTAIKVFVSCRDSAYLTLSPKKHPTLSLYTEDRHVKAAINAYAAQKLEEGTEKLADWDFSSDEISRLVSLISEKSDGMFLWARLVLDYLDSEIYYDKNEIYRAIEEIPSKLSDLYKRILGKITNDLEPRSVSRMATSLAWIAFSYRPLRLYELQSALAFSSGEQEISCVPPKRVIEPFKLLVEEKPDSTLAFIHFSVAE
ncbi:zinc finger protein [Colletotrichum musicola]|uniref:Zinc finger protein n=1 Tax=Colletotrichum musicola TaxID=2175873 RepID=A0A8H6J9E8_9PEZI|nr:zinc finger protein [Colletotrichum musicola]